MLPLCWSHYWIHARLYGEMDERYIASLLEVLLRDKGHGKRNGNYVARKVFFSHYLTSQYGCILLAVAVVLLSRFVSFSLLSCNMVIWGRGGGIAAFLFGCVWNLCVWPFGQPVQDVEYFHASRGSVIRCIGWRWFFRPYLNHVAQWKATHKRQYMYLKLRIWLHIVIKLVGSETLH